MTPKAPLGFQERPKTPDDEAPTTTAGREAEEENMRKTEAREFQTTAKQ